MEHYRPVGVVFYLFILENQINDLVVFVNNTEVSLTAEYPICYIHW